MWTRSEPEVGFQVCHDLVSPHETRARIASGCMLLCNNELNFITGAKGEKLDTWNLTD